MNGLIYLTLEQAEDIHAKTIQYSGGGTYERFDLGRLDSVLHLKANLRIYSFVCASFIVLQTAINALQLP